MKIQVKKKTSKKSTNKHRRVMRIDGNLHLHKKKKTNEILCIDIWTDIIFVFEIHLCHSSISWNVRGPSVSCVLPTKKLSGFARGAKHLRCFNQGHISRKEREK